MQPKIVRVPILPRGLINAHLVIGAHGTILVDAGLPDSEHKVEAALRRENRRMEDISLIVVTHAHVDHAGSASRIRERSGAPIVGHEADASHFGRETPMTFCPTGWFGRLFLCTKLMLEPYVGFRPDIELAVGAELDMAQYGVDGVIRHTPGHTEGSISVELPTGDALVGDLLASGILLGGIARTDHAKRPPFEDDPGRVAEHLVRMVDAGYERFHVGHGGPVAAAEVARHARDLRALSAMTCPPRM